MSALLVRHLKRLSRPLAPLVRMETSNYGDLSQYQLLEKLEGTSFDAYNEEGFSINNVFHKGSVLAFNNMAFLWNVKSYKDITLESLAVVNLFNPGVDLLLIGTGSEFHRLDPEIVSYFDKFNISVESMNSASACSTFNFLHDEGRRVAAAIVAIEPKPYEYDDVLEKRHNEFGNKV